MIGLMMLAAGTLAATPSGQARSDLTCLEATSWAISTIAPADADKQAVRANLETLRVFFLGRLSGRDDRTNWIAAAQREMREVTNASYAIDLEPCSQAFLRTMKGD